MKIIKILFLLFFISSCKLKSTKYSNLTNDSLKYTNQIGKIILPSINIYECDWVYRGKLLTKRKIKQLKLEMDSNLSVLKITTVSSVSDSLKKYKTSKNCIVVLN